MRLLQVFWSEPVHNPGGEKFLGGFRDLESFLTVWALSVCSARRYFPQAILMTDERGKSMAERLGLPYDTIETSLSSIACPPGFWNIGKFFAFQRQDAPFVYLDLDFILHQALPAHLISAPLAVQRKEDQAREALFYRSALKHMLLRPDLLPAAWSELSSEQLSGSALNCSLLVVNSPALIREYAAECLRTALNPEFISLAASASQGPGIKPWYFAVTIEQIGLALACRRQGLEPSCLGASGENESSDYQHLIHVQKRDRLLLQNITNRLSKVAPQIQERIRRVAADIG